MGVLVQSRGPYRGHGEPCVRERRQRWDSKSVRSALGHGASSVSGCSLAIRKQLRRLRPVSYTHLTLPTICSV
eukprot:7494650-Alexandrium_andersonii.AAC.1